MGSMQPAQCRDELQASDDPTENESRCWPSECRSCSMQQCRCLCGRRPLPPLCLLQQSVLQADIRSTGMRRQGAGMSHQSSAARGVLAGRG